MNNTDELCKIAEMVNGYIEHDSDGPYIQIDTGDNTPKENGDDLISIVSDIEPMLDLWEITNSWADHDTQIIEFNLKEKK